MKKQLFTWGCLLIFLAGAFALQNRDLGRRYEVGDRMIDRKAELGVQMFASNWPVDAGAAFNENRCTGCHVAPRIGGVLLDRKRDVKMVPDPNSPTGWSNYRRRQEGVGDRPAPPATAVARKTPALYGVGLLEAVPDLALLSLADPNDRNKDGISGRLPIVATGFGRFGWKSHHSNLNDFVHEAYAKELGIDSAYKGELNIDDNQIEATVIFLQLLTPPAASPEAENMPGRKLFDTLACGSCHTPALKTGDSGLAPLRGQVVRAYTDLLLHQMGDGPAHDTPKRPHDREVRTPPLWGIGRIPGPYMHDLSASTFDEAIRKHGGEGRASAKAYEALSESDRQKVIDFLKAL